MKDSPITTEPTPSEQELKAAEEIAIECGLCDQPFNEDEKAAIADCGLIIAKHTRCEDEYGQMRDAVYFRAIASALRMDFENLKGRFCEHHGTPGGCAPGCPECRASQAESRCAELAKERDELAAGLERAKQLFGELGHDDPEKNPECRVCSYIKESPSASLAKHDEKLLCKLQDAIGDHWHDNLTAEPLEKRIMELEAELDEFKRTEPLKRADYSKLLGELVKVAEERDGLAEYICADHLSATELLQSKELASAISIAKARRAVCRAADKYMTLDPETEMPEIAAEDEVLRDALARLRELEGEER